MFGKCDVKIYNFEKNLYINKYCLRCINFEIYTHNLKKSVSIEYFIFTYSIELS